MSETAVFSDMWHLVAQQRINLRPHVRVRRQYFRGEPWHVLSDPLNNRYYRFRPEAWSFIARLDGKSTVDEAWQSAIERPGEAAIGQQEAVQVLSQLFSSGLVVTDANPDAVQQFLAARKQHVRSLRSQALNFLFLRIPLLDPDRWLDSIRGILRLLLNPVTAVIWLLVVVWALKGVAEESAELFSASAGILAPENLLLLYISWAAIKLLHEFGHAAMTKHFGGEVHTMGVMLLVFTPIPYMDASAAWDFPQRRKRLLVGSAGMIFELFVAALAFFVWRASGPGAVQQIAYNLMFLASVSTVLFNGNPLLRFDGYYILSDLLDVPNLHQAASRHARHLLERYAFGLRKSISPARSKAGAWGYSSFLLASTAYRIFVLTVIILFIGAQIFEIGLLIAAYCILLWGVAPVVKFVRYLITESRLEPVRGRVQAVAGATMAVALLLLAVIPFPAHFRASGILEARETVEVIAHADGFLREVRVRSGDWVEAGQELLVIADPQHPLELAHMAARMRENEARSRWARDADPAYLGPLRGQMEAFERQLDLLTAFEQQRVVRAPQAGFFVAPQLDGSLGIWIRRGTALGTLVDTGPLAFTAVVTQKEVSRIFAGEIRSVSLRFPGQAGRSIHSQEWEWLAADQTRLPSAALGWLSGGKIAVQGGDRSGLETTEPFFVVRVWLRKDYPDLPEADRITPDQPQFAVDGVTALHLRRGVARFKLPSQPIAMQAWLGLRRLLQDRYQL